MLFHQLTKISINNLLHNFHIFPKEITSGYWALSLASTNEELNFPFIYLFKNNNK